MYPDICFIHKLFDVVSVEVKYIDIYGVLVMFNLTRVRTDPWMLTFFGGVLVAPHSDLYVIVHVQVASSSQPASSQ